MIACDAKYLHRPARPDFERWPFDVPSIMDKMKQHQFTVANAGSGLSAEVYSQTGQRWMDRALKAEADLRYAVVAAELMIKSYEERLAKMEPRP